ncbi:MAG: hypothetical protein HY541_08675, partial [Deltaproteobacteria bacterium]|nr:hypothetical protein [Deltaproteobacteria bacterium]
ACLPITSQMGETQPLVKGVDIAAVGGKSRMCVATLDTGYGETGGLCKSSDTAVRDTGFAQYRGGLWCSDNMGKSWTYRKEAKDNPSSTFGNWIRCGSDGDTKDTTTYNKAKINPQNLDHLIVSAATGRGATSGIWEHRIFENGVYEWQNMASAHAGSSKVQKGLCYVGAATKLNITNENCFEGNRSGDLFQDNYAPELLPSSAFHVSNWDDLTKFALRFITGRGAIKATWKDGSNWSDGKGRYYLDHEHTSPVSSGITSIMSVWKGSGASDYCPSGGLAFLDDAGVNLVSAGGDSGLLRSTDGGGSWRLVRDSVNYLTDWKIPSDFHFDDADAEILLDDDNKIIYASNYSAKTSESSNSVVTAPADQPDSWSVLGGYCYSTTTDSSGGAVCGTSDDNGLPGSVEVYDLALDFSRTEDRRVLAGAKGGLYLYDPQKTSPQWTLFSGNGCLTPESGETIKVKGLWTDKEYPNLILAAFYSNASVYETEMARSGIYAVTLNETSYSCEKLGASETSPKLRTPTLVTLAESGGTISLVTAGIYRGYPVLYYSPVTLTGGKADASSVDWQLALDFNYTISKNIPSDTATNWKAYLADHADWKTEYEHEYFSKKSFSTLETVPGRRDIVLAGMNGSPSYDYHVVGHLYESVDGGKTFKVAEKWDDLPMKSMAQINFSPDNKKIYFSTACTSIWEACNSYVEENACVE